MACDDCMTSLAVAARASDIKLLPLWGRWPEGPGRKQLGVGARGCLNPSVRDPTSRHPLAFEAGVLVEDRVRRAPEATGLDSFHGIIGMDDIVCD
jgi:hypothetical protein